MAGPGGVTSNTPSRAANRAQQAAALATEDQAPDLSELSERRLLKIGASGAETKKQIAEAQDLLVKKGLLEEGEFTPGVYDKTTADAVTEYRTANGLTIDGKIGQQTWASLLELEGADTVKPGVDQLKDGGVREAWGGAAGGTRRAPAGGEEDVTNPEAQAGSGGTQTTGNTDDPEQAGAGGARGQTDEEMAQAAAQAQQQSYPKSVLGSTVNIYANRIAAKHIGNAGKAAPWVESTNARFSARMAERSAGKLDAKAAEKLAQAEKLRANSTLAADPEKMLNQAAAAEKEAEALKAQAVAKRGEAAKFRQQVADMKAKPSGAEAVAEEGKAVRGGGATRAFSSDAEKIATLGKDVDAKVALLEKATKAKTAAFTELKDAQRALENVKNGNQVVSGYDSYLAQAQARVSKATKAARAAHDEANQAQGALAESQRRLGLARKPPDPEMLAKRIERLENRASSLQKAVAEKGSKVANLEAEVQKAEQNLTYARRFPDKGLTIAEEEAQKAHAALDAARSELKQTRKLLGDNAMSLQVTKKNAETLDKLIEGGEVSRVAGSSEKATEKAAEKGVMRRWASGAAEKAKAVANNTVDKAKAIAKKVLPNKETAEGAEQIAENTAQKAAAKKAAEKALLEKNTEAVERGGEKLVEKSAAKAILKGGGKFFARLGQALPYVGIGVSTYFAQDDIRHFNEVKKDPNASWLKKSLAGIAAAGSTVSAVGSWAHVVPLLGNIVGSGVGLTTGIISGVASLAEGFVK